METKMKKKLQNLERLYVIAKMSGRLEDWICYWDELKVIKAELDKLPPHEKDIILRKYAKG